MARDLEKIAASRGKIAETRSIGTADRFEEVRREPSDNPILPHQNGQLKLGVDRGVPSPAQSVHTHGHSAPSPVSAPASHKPKRKSAMSAGLDQELHGRAEAAIEAFRSSFDAALMEGSVAVRERLRQAASDLMRVAARTTIVLDRLNASGEQTVMRIPEHLRSGQNGEYR